MPLLAAALLFTLHLQEQPRGDCREWHECREMALAAAAAGEYERFHDLAWRAIQTGPRNDTGLMYLLARAQSLSGRPGDALVMLQRLAALGVATDAATSDDFRRVRALPAWTEFAGSAPRVPEKAAPENADAFKASKPDAPKARPADDAMRFETLPFTPAGLAYDAVSRRFIVGDRRARRLAVVDEFSRHVANLASAQSAGFGDIAAIEIDPRQGDLWVLSADGPRATLHKLQLISGRVLASYTPAGRFGDVDLADVAATPDNGVLVLDRAGHRVFHLRPKASELELALTLPDDRPSSIAPAGAGAAYVAHATGIWRVDVASRSVADVRPAKGVDVSGIARLRWHKGTLIAVQRTAGGGYAAVRIGLDGRGHTATAVHPLEASLSGDDPTAATVSGGALYYLAPADASGMTVRKVLLK